MEELQFAKTGACQDFLMKFAKLETNLLQIVTIRHV